jgi:integrase
MKASTCERKQKTKRGYRTRHKGIFRLPGGGYRVRARGLCPKTRRGREREEILPHATLHAAYQRQQELRAEIENEPTTATAAITLGDYARSWIAQQTTRLGRDDGHRYSTVRDRADVLEQHILPVVGQVCMDRLTRADLMRWQSVMQQKRKKNGTLYSNVTINNWWRILRAMVRRAVLDLDLSRDPTLGIKALRERKNAKVKLTSNQLVEFLALTFEQYPQHFAMVVTLAASGLRFGEVSALQWDDLHEAELLIQVKRSQVRGRLGLPKNGKSRTSVVPSFVFDVLRWHRQRMMRNQAAGVHTALIFPSATGGYRYPSVLAKPFKRIADQMAISESIGAHHLRHAFNHLLRKGGVDRMVLRAMVGHSSEEMTQHYSEAETEEMRAASEQHIAPIFDLVQKRISLSADQTGVVTGVGDNNSDDAELRKAVNGDVSTLTSK